ncbi:MAG TPA: hypothetical protein VMM92_07045, partial [Thermoanaerobaculia bacterium]|nr:hypothetical protein [Thermoanaerobaculia bacterium]
MLAKPFPLLRRTVPLLLLITLLVAAGGCGRGTTEKTSPPQAAGTEPAAAAPAAPGTASGQDAATSPSARAVTAQGSGASAPVPLPGTAAAAGVRSVTDRRGTGRFTLTGAYKAEVTAVVSCSLLEDSLEVSWSAAGQPRIALHVPKFHGTGIYPSKVEVVANDASEQAFRQSSGAPQARIDVSGGPVTVKPDPHGA